MSSKPSVTISIVWMLFFLSGAAALLYQVAWSRYLSLLMGSTAEAQSVTLAAFMLGLALGYFWMGRLAASLRSPLKTFAVLEILIAAYALLFDPIYTAADAVFAFTGAAMAGQPFLLTSLKMVVGFGLIVPPTLLMGATLPLLIAWARRVYGPRSPWASSALYAVNTLGAAAGAFLAGLWFMPGVGMRNTVLLGGMADLLVGAAILLLLRRLPVGHTRGGGDGASASERTAAAPKNATGLHGAYMVVALAGGAALAFQVLAARQLAMVFGGSTQAFAIMLVASILGVGLGAAVVSGLKEAGRAMAVTRTLVLGVAVFIAGMVATLLFWIDAYLLVRYGLARTVSGYLMMQGVLIVFALFFAGLPAALLGAVLPYWIRQCPGDDSISGTAGRLLAVDTVAAVIGALAGGFLLLPLLGLRGSFLALALILVAGALVAGGWRVRRSDLWAPLAAGVVVLASVFVGSGHWKEILTMGFHRAPAGQDNRMEVRERTREVELLFFRDGPDATVSVERSLSPTDPQLSLRVNGKVDASSRSDLSTQLLIGHLPLAMRPEAEEVFLLGLGSGISASAILAHPIRRLTLAENTSGMREAAAVFANYNRDALEDPRLDLHREDGRILLKLSQRKFDVIISQPSNLWVTGTGNLFTSEFYALAAQRLKPGGILAQWLQTYEMDGETVALVMRTFSAAFPVVEVWETGLGDILLLGAFAPWASDHRQYGTVFERELVRQDLERLGILSPTALWARQIASQRVARAIADPEGVLQTDRRPRLEYLAPRALYMGRDADFFTPFDERLRLRWLADPEKERRLQMLGADTLLAIFLEFPSTNSQLMERIRLPRGPESPPTQTIFQRRGRQQSAYFKPANVSPELDTLLVAEVVAEAQPERIGEAVQTMLQTLRTYPLGEDRDPLLEYGRPAYYYGLAVMLAIRDNDYALATATVREALGRYPQDPALQFLRRYLD